MPRKPRSIKPDPAPPVEETAPEENLEEIASDLEVEEKIHEFREQFGAGAGYVVRIEKFDPLAREWAWADRYPLDDFDPFVIRERFGPGKYRLRLFSADHHYIKGGAMSFTFAALLEKPEEAKKEYDPLANPAVQLIVENMKNQNAMLTDILKSLMPQAAGATNQKADLVVLIEALKGLNSLAPKDTGVKSVEDALKLAMIVRDAFEKDEPKASGGVISEIKEAIQLLPLLKGEVDSRLAARSTPAALPSGNPPDAGKAPGTVGDRIIPGQGTVVVREGSKKPEERTMNPIVEKVLFYVPKFEEAARKQEPVTRWANFLLDVIDNEVIPGIQEQYGVFALDGDAVYDRLMDQAENPASLEKIFVYAPSLLPYKEWVLRVVAEAVFIVNNPEDSGFSRNPEEPMPVRENNQESGNGPP